MLKLRSSPHGLKTSSETSVRSENCQFPEGLAWVFLPVPDVSGPVASAQVNPGFLG